MTEITEQMERWRFRAEMHAKPLTSVPDLATAGRRAIGFYRQGMVVRRLIAIERGGVVPFRQLLGPAVIVSETGLIGDRLLLYHGAVIGGNWRRVEAVSWFVIPACVYRLGVDDCGTVHAFTVAKAQLRGFCHPPEDAP